MLNEKNLISDFIKGLGSTLIAEAGSGSLYYEYYSLKTGKVYIRISDHLSSKNNKAINIIYNLLNDNITVINNGFVYSGKIDDIKMCVYTLIMSSVNGLNPSLNNEIKKTVNEEIKTETKTNTKSEAKTKTITEIVNESINKDKKNKETHNFKYSIIDSMPNVQSLSLNARIRLEEIIDEHQEILTMAGGMNAIETCINNSMPFAKDSKVNYISSFFKEFFKSPEQVIKEAQEEKPVVNNTVIQSVELPKCIKVYGDKLENRIRDFFNKNPEAGQDIVKYIKDYAGAKLEHKIFMFDELLKRYNKLYLFLYKRKKINMTLNIFKLIQLNICKHEYVKKQGIGFKNYEVCRKCGKVKE